jgi:hypothetical protein
MGKILPWIGPIALITILSTVSICHVQWLSDRNAFLKEFVNHEFLATLGFIAAVTLASAANVHLELNRLEDETDILFIETRLALKRSVYSLIILLGLAVVLVVLKPLSDVLGRPGAVYNSASLIITYIYIMILYDLSAVVFKIPTKKKIKEIQSGIDGSA